MSRIGKLPVTIPSAVTMTLQGQELKLKGPKGELSMVAHPNVILTPGEGSITVTVKDPDEKFDRSLWGLTRVLINNMVTGVTVGFQKKLEINGVGFKAAVAGQKMTLNLGFSHPVEYEIPQGITATVEKNVITIAGIDKQLVGETAAKIRSFKKPEPYKGKGIKYDTEVIRRKAGKVVKAAGAK
jgi:large subunit ribosomal protein L6